ncbi:TetR/AcrR family transcriptional regulator [Alkalibaculum sporogenes]|uniref:TetR/AcrR family transcriptional regulator n=1 Tax=Alkalibaculum sporogenes TaxID=2655001 RepID=UPI00187B4643|nr:TetR/AcrR family transcriptional regulator [Alkalibaculum sporogenes]
MYVEIAKEASVSTGIVYRYFEDKKDIFIASLDLYSSTFYDTLFVELRTLTVPINISVFLEKIIDTFVERHNVSKFAHEEMLAMSHSDPDVAKYFYESEENVTERICDLLPALGLDIINAHEKIHIITNIIENYCHEVVYHKHPYMNYAIMKTIVIEAIEKILYCY